MDLPADLQQVILGGLSLRGMALLACLSKELRKRYLERVKQRDAVVAGLLESHFTPEFRQGLSGLQTALSRDLIVDPPVRLPLSVPLAPCYEVG